MDYMLDTNICIYIIKRRPPEVIRRFRESEVSRIGISSITLSELFYGASKSAYPARNRIALTQFAAPLEIAPYDDEAAERCGDIRADLEKQGTPIGALDLLLAAHALSLGCTLVTNNAKESARIPTLNVANWVSR